MMEYSITLPSKPRIVSEEAQEGVYEIDGLYPGYGHTLVRAGSPLLRATRGLLGFARSLPFVRK